METTIKLENAPTLPDLIKMLADCGYDVGNTRNDHIGCYASSLARQYVCNQYGGTPQHTALLTIQYDRKSHMLTYFHLYAE